MPAVLSRVMWPVRTERLMLRPATEADVDATWDYRRLPSVGEWITAYPTDRVGYSHLFLTPARLARTVLVESDGVVIGDLMFAVGNAWGQSEVLDATEGVQAEIGWAFDPAHAGRGLATEAVAALLAVAFDGFGLRRVFADCFAANERSWRLMERVGMRREAVHRADCLHRSGQWMDGLVYALLADEWRVRFDRLSEAAAGSLGSAGASAALGSAGAAGSLGALGSAETSAATRPATGQGLQA